MTSETRVPLQVRNLIQNTSKEKKGDFLVQGCAASFPETTKAIDLVGGELQGNMIYE